MRKLKREELARRIDATGMKPFAFAQAHGIVSESLRRWLNGQREPKIDNIRQLAEALHCDVSDISEWQIVIDADKMHQRDEQLDELRYLWTFLTDSQRQQVLALLRSIAEPKIKEEGKGE